MIKSKEQFEKNSICYEIQDLVNYLWDDEQNHFNEMFMQDKGKIKGSKKEIANHIYTKLKRVEQWLKTQ